MPSNGLADPNFPQLFAATLARNETQLVDQVVTTHPTFELLKGTAKSGTGNGMVVPVRVAKLGATGYSRDGNGTHSTTVSPEIIGSITYGWCDEIITPFTMKHRDQLVNQGKEAIANLFKEYQKAAAEDHQDFLAAALWAPKENYVAGDLQSLDYIIDDETVLCGLDPAVKTWWKSSVVTSSAATESIEKAFRRVMNTVFAVARKRPTHIIAGSDVYEEFEAAAETRSGGQAPGAPSLALGFQAIMYKGIEVRLDPECPTDKAFFIHQPSLRFEYLAGEFMKAYEPHRKEGGLNSTIPLASTLSLGTTERRAHAKLIRTV